MEKLNQNLIAVTKPLINESKCIKGDKYRISVITPRLLRVEISKEGKFTDSATQSIWFRDFNDTVFTTKEEKNHILIETDKVIFCFCKVCLKVLHVTFKDTDKKVSVNRVNTLSYNLKGTARTLDFTFGARPLKRGIMSYKGVSVYDDSKSLLLDTDGTVKEREHKEKDLYLFAYGRDYIGCLKDFFKLTGEVPLIPRYALSNWWSRYWAYTQDEYISLMEKFIEEDIPITVATVDMDWHWVDLKRFGDDYKGTFGWCPGWTGYSWNSDLFPDYKAFLKWLQDHNFKVTLNLHPADGVRDFENMYKEMALEMGLDPESKETIKFNITDPKFMNAYFKILHTPYEREGVDFWWIDWQQGKSSGMKGLDPLWALNHYHFLDNAKNKRPLILSRYAGIGSHRYPLGFSGDTAINWRVFNFQPYFTSTASNAGYTWWSHDIGGHHWGYKDDELFLRWVQFGVFSPIMRLHSSSDALLGKEPWRFHKDIEIFVKEQLRLRHRLLPYIYTMNYRTHSEGRALIEPMYYNNPESEAAYYVKNQYYFGSELIVCPITRRKDLKVNMSYTDVWLPKGRWTDIFNGTVYNGERWLRMFRGYDSIPVLAKEGAIIPFSENKGNDWKNPEEMTLYVFRGNSSFTLYEDEGCDNGYREGKYAKTLFSVSEGENLEFRIEKADGDLSIIPEKRTYNICLKDVISASDVIVKVNGKLIKAVTDSNDGYVKILLSDMSSKDCITVSVKNYKVRENIPYMDAAIKIMSYYQTSNIFKSHQFKKLRKCQDKNQFIEKLKTLMISENVKFAILEYIN